MYFRSYRVGKTCLRNCLTSRFLEQHRIVNILKAPKLCWNLRNGSFLYFFTTARYPWFEKVSNSHIENLRTVCLLIDCR